MGNVFFTPMAIDALGEMMNISLGSSATAVSNMLDHRVDITTPKVSVVKVQDFTLGNLEPAMGVEIKYVEGLDGSNIMLLKRSDVKVIVDILMGTETPEEEFELNELTISCVCEVMNQMMGAAATALSDFLGFPVNISTPEPFNLDDINGFKESHMPKGAQSVVVVRFSLKIENALESEFMNVISVELAKDLLGGLGLGNEVSAEGDASTAPAAQPAPAPAPEPSGGSNRTMSQAEIEEMLASMNGGGAPEPAPAPAPEPSGNSNRVMSQEEIEKMLAEMNAGGGPAPAPAPQPEPAAPAATTPQQSPAAAAQPQPQPQPQQAPAASAQQMPFPGQPGMPGQMMPFPMPGADGAFPNGYMGYPPMYYPPYPYPYPPQPPQEEKKKPPEPKVINTKPMAMKEMEATESLSQEQAENLDLIMEVPLQVTVEIGRARRKVQDILEFTKGSLVVLDKLAGDQVDLFVNGKCIARGDVVVVEDNFGVRITEIVQNTGVELFKKK